MSSKGPVGILAGRLNGEELAHVLLASQISDTVVVALELEPNKGNVPFSEGKVKSIIVSEES